MRFPVVALVFAAGMAHAGSAPLAPRTLVVGLEIDRQAAHVTAYTMKDRAFLAPEDPAAPRPYAAEGPLQVELVLRGPAGSTFLRRVDVGPLCLLHPVGDPPHVVGDRIRVHRDSFVAEFPELPGFDRLEIAVYDPSGTAASRRVLGLSTLDAERFTPAGGRFAYGDLAFADSSNPPALPTSLAAATVQWPEDFGESQTYVLFGDETQADRRINVVLVPDGYRHQDKALMEAHATALVQHFRAKTPYAEHDPFLNYVLVYAYSAEAGTDQCDCSIVVNSAMGTRFPLDTPVCGSSDNRCLYYGGGCDTPGTSNIVAAELRAPYQDTTIVMVNTTRYGGCGGARAVYSAANGSAQEVAVHELGHSLAGLADEYTAFSGCGFSAGEINTSTNASQGAWPEWTGSLGSPREGADYYPQCLYRPFDNCEMRALDQPFCAVCRQRWSLVTFGHPRIAPTAPIDAASPSSPLAVWTGQPVPFDLTTRLSAGPGVTNSITWKLSGPGMPLPFTVASGVTSHTQTFAQAGSYTLTAQVVADTNFVKPSKNGANVDSVTWNVQATVPPPPPEVSSPASAVPLRFTSKIALIWENAGAAGVFTYNVYRGTLGGLPAGNYGTCLLQNLSNNNTTLAADVPPAGSPWCYLVTGENSQGEGSLGQDSSGHPRTNGTPCP